MNLCYRTQPEVTQLTLKFENKQLNQGWTISTWQLFLVKDSWLPEFHRITNRIGRPWDPQVSNRTSGGRWDKQYLSKMLPDLGRSSYLTAPPTTYDLHFLHRKLILFQEAIPAHSYIPCLPPLPLPSGTWISKSPTTNCCLFSSWSFLTSIL